MATTTLYRGTSKQYADDFVKAVAPKQFDATGSGEFGAGCYFWLEDLPAAVMTALQYNAAERDWAVIAMTFDNTELQKLAERQQGFGSRVLEFGHKKGSPFEGAAEGPGRFVVPPAYSHMTGDRNDVTHVPARDSTVTPPTPGSFGIMDSRQFRNINASPDKYGLDGEKNKIAWQYDLVIGLCAAAYTDEALVQYKFANHGLTLINNRHAFPRVIVVYGRRVTRRMQVINAWKMSGRKKIYDDYIHRNIGTNIDLDTLIGGG